MFSYRDYTQESTCRDNGQRFRLNRRALRYASRLPLPPFG
jgi:hypothetical protein